MTDRTAIVLSAGYFGFFAHAGFMLALEESGLEYCAISGSSAGAIVAAMHAAGMPAQKIIDLLLGIRRKDFWDSTGMRGILAGLARRGKGWTGLLKGDQFERLIQDYLPVKSFEDCSQRLYITALNLTRGADETFFSGTIADKVRASCSYPFLLTPKVIDGSEYWDGGFLSKVPIETMLEKEAPERVIIHYLPGADRFPAKTPLAELHWAPVAMLERALTVARTEIEAHRLKLLDAVGDKITWIKPELPRVSPRDLSTGKEAVESAYQFARKIL